jgi:hypothetical protein
VGGNAKTESQWLTIQSAIAEFENLPPTMFNSTHGATLDVRTQIGGFL